MSGIILQIIIKLSFDLNHKIMNISKHFLFYQQVSEIITDNTYIVNVSNIETKSELLYLYYRAFNFPDYFGFNWDALEDFLYYLDEFVNKDKVSIIHNDFLNLMDKDFYIYIDILNNVCERWSLHADVLKIYIYFPETYRNRFRIMETVINQ